MFNVYVTRKIPSKGIDLLKKYAKVKVWEGELPPSKERILKEVESVDGILSLLTDQLDKEVLGKARNLKVISNYAVGYDNIDLSEATRRRIVVTNTPDVLTETTADFAFGLMMAVARKVVLGDNFVRNGMWKTWGPMLLLGNDIYQATLGIIGMGRIGQAVARRAQGFSMEVLYYNSGPVSDYVENKLNARKVSLDDLLKNSNFVSIHLPLTPNTQKLIGNRELKLMKKEAILINTARGPIVDEDALIECLKNETIAGAGLDVFQNEPIHSQNPLCNMDNVVLAPHIASASVQTRTKMAMMAAKSIVDVLHGKTPENVVNPEVINCKS